MSESLKNAENAVSRLETFINHPYSSGKVQNLIEDSRASIQRALQDHTLETTQMDAALLLWHKVDELESVALRIDAERKYKFLCDVLDQNGDVSQSDLLLDLYSSIARAKDAGNDMTDLEGRVSALDREVQLHNQRIDKPIIHLYGN